jgi:uncharacterized protein (TIGR02001 family)
MKTITLITLFVGALAFITNAYASVSGNLGVTTDYLWRGASQGDGVSLSGGLDYAGEGYYAGIWTSSLGGSGEYETDFYIGTDVNGFDVGVISYEYSEAAADLDFQEYYVGYSFQGFDLFYAVNVDDSDADYFSVSYGLPTLVEGVSSSLTYGDTGAGAANDEDYLQLDIAYGDLTLTVLDTDAGTSTALSYGWSL